MLIIHDECSSCRRTCTVRFEEFGPDQVPLPWIVCNSCKKKTEIQEKRKTMSGALSFSDANAGSVSLIGEK